MTDGLQLAIDGLYAAYDGNPVLHDVSLDVAAGEIVALLGPSGCGKTTLLRCIAGLEEPTAGRIVIGRRDVTAGRGVPAEKRRVGMVFQEGALFPHRTVVDNVGYGVARGRQRDERGAASLRLVGLEDKAQRMPGTLSGGEQQRVALARALAPEPGVMLLDEPFSSLDAGLRWQLRGEVRRLLKQVGVTTILVTHDQEEALTFGDRVVVMRAGAVEQMGSPGDVYARPASPWVARFVGEANLFDATFSAGGADTVIGRVPTVVGADGVGDGEGILLGRPEQLVLAAGDAADEAATVTTVSHFGRDTRYEVTLAAGPIVTVRTPGPPQYQTGASVCVHFADGRAFGWPRHQMATGEGPARPLDSAPGGY